MLFHNIYKSIYYQFKYIIYKYITMGCDYYILIVLRIYCENYFLDIELTRERGYYYYNFDEDEEDYEDKVSNYINNILTPKMNPIVLYDNNNFLKPSFETKYKTIIDNQINKNNVRWSDIRKIIKLEERYEI
jgi:hypothetical protein